MEFRFTVEDETFRKEIRGFLQQELPDHWHQVLDTYDSEEAHAFAGVFQKKLAQRGWFTLAWPKEYGGAGASVFRQVIFNEEMGYQRAPASDMSVQWVGPALMIYGSPEQKQKFLPPISGADLRFCTLYTEPGAGSDLAALQTRALEDGDDYVLNGQKIFTSGAHYAHWGWLAARTDVNAPKHRGISMFVVDMKTPGITIRPLINMAGVHAQNEVFFDDVRIPKEDLVGERNRGWYQLAVALDFERSGISGFAAHLRTFHELVEFARETRRNGEVLAQEPGVRAKLAELAIELDIARWFSYRIAWMQSAGKIPNKEASVAKAFTSEMSQRLANVGMQVLGLYGQLRPGSRWTPLAGRFERMYRAAVVSTIGGGSSEIQRNIIAGRGLGLPR